LTMYNQQKLVELSNIYEISSEALVKNKELGFKKIWFDNFLVLISILRSFLRFSSVLTEIVFATVQ